MKQTKTTFSVLLFFLLSELAFGQKDYEWKEASSGGYTYKYVTDDPLEARYYVLSNGLTVITSVNKKEPRIQTIIATKAGSKTDPANHTGLAHYLEHMLFKGTDKFGTLNWNKEKPLLDVIDKLYEQYNNTHNETERAKIYRQIDSVSGLAAQYAIANEYDNMMASIGAKGTNAFTSFEETAYVNDIPSNRVDQWLKIEAERFRNPVFRMFHTELEAVYEEKNISLDNDLDQVFEKLFAGLFRKHNYGLQTTIGTVEHLKNPSLPEIRKYYETYYVPNNMVIVLSGDFDPDELVKKVDASFGYMKAKKVPEYIFSPEDALTRPMEISVLGTESEYLTFGFVFPGAADAQTHILEILADFLSNGKAGLLDGLVTRRQVLSADAGAYLLKDYSVLYFSAVPKEGQTLEELKDIILAEVERLKKGDFDEGLIQAIVFNKRLQDMRAAESNTGRAFELLEGFITGRDRASALKGEASKLKLSKKEITEYARKHLSNAPVIVYKRQGKNPETVKVEKPPITPVEVNRDKESPFAKEILAMKTPEIKAEFPDFKRDVILGEMGYHQVIQTKNTVNDLFALHFLVPVGYKYSPLLRVLEYYFRYAGAGKMSAEEYDKELYKLAATVSMSVQEEETYFTLRGLNQNFSGSYRLFRDKLKYPEIKEEIIQSVTGLILKERSDAKMNPDQYLSRLYSYGYYKGLNPFTHILSADQLKTLTGKELKSLMDLMMNSAYRILYYGPFSEDELIRELNRGEEVSLTPKTPASPVKFMDYELRKPENAEAILVNYDKVQTDILWLFNGADFKADMLPVVAVYNEYFGGGMSSVVFQEIRESKALAYNTYSYYDVPSDKKYPFRFVAYVGCQGDKVSESLDAMYALLEKMPKSIPKFLASKASLKFNISTSRITGENLISEYLRAEKLGIKVPVNQFIAERMDAITYTDIEKFQQSYIAASPKYLIIFGNLAKMDRSVLKKYFTHIRPVSEEELFGY